MIDYASVFIFFFAVIDPIGTVPVFIAVTRHLDEASKRRIAIKAALDVIEDLPDDGGVLEPPSSRAQAGACLPG
jgi:hypothetical protein